MTGTVKPNTPCCPECGDTGVYLDCTAYWEDESEQWEMSDGNDNDATCPSCDWTGRKSELQTVEQWDAENGTDDQED